MADDERRVTLERIDEGVYLARNARGAEVRFGSKADDAFSPVELFLAAIAGCTAVDVDVVTGRRAEADTFGATIEAVYVRDGEGNRLDDIRLSFQVTFPAGPAGDAAREILPRVLKQSHDRTCTVSRTVESGTSIGVTAGPPPVRRGHDHAVLGRFDGADAGPAPPAGAPVIRRYG